MSTTQMDIELQAALAIVRVGLSRIRDLACATEDVEPHIKALRTLHGTRQAPGVLDAVADIIGTITVSISDIDNARHEDITECLDEAQAYTQDHASSRVRQAADLLGDGRVS